MSLTDETIERIETKIAFLERANLELSDVVYRQRQELDELRAHLLEISGRLETLKVESGEPGEAEERPPHY